MKKSFIILAPGHLLTHEKTKKRDFETKKIKKNVGSNFGVKNIDILYSCTLEVKHIKQIINIIITHAD